MPNDKNGAVGGLSEQDMGKIRELRGYIQTEVTDEAISNRDAVLWAVENELERYQE